MPHGQVELKGYGAIKTKLADREILRVIDVHLIVLRVFF
jgi:hypothetical protein